MFGEKLPLSNIAFEYYKKYILGEKLFVCMCVCLYIMRQTPIQHFAFKMSH